MTHSIENTAYVYLPKVGSKKPAGCPAMRTPTYRIFKEVIGERIPRADEYSCMKLCHYEHKKAGLKTSLDLKKIHQELEIASLHIRFSGASNVLLAKVSFDCKITLLDGTSLRDYIYFDLKIPQADTVLSYETVETAYGSKQTLYNAMKRFHAAGKAVANPDGHKHGVCPDYNPELPSQDQFIRHTEQLLVAYLMLPEASVMLLNRLHVELRSRYASAASVKLYHMGLHLHSTKTCCAACENTLLGLSNYRNYYIQNGKRRGFLALFQDCVKRIPMTIKFNLPVTSYFNVITTVGASELDAIHKKQYSYLFYETQQKILKDFYTSKAIEGFKEDFLKSFQEHTLIDVKAPSSSQTIFTALLDLPYDHRRLADCDKFYNYTVCISGSLATPGSKKTKDQAKKLNKIQSHPSIEMDSLFEI